MKLHSRLVRLQKRWDAERPDGGPLTVFLRETNPELPVGQRVVWGGVGLEIVFDPAQGMPELPPGGPHKLILGLDPDWV
jgi:hypothetical protein